MQIAEKFDQSFRSSAVPGSPPPLLTPAQAMERIGGHVLGHISVYDHAPIAALLRQHHELRGDLDALRKEVIAMRGERDRQVINPQTWLVPEKKLAEVTSCSRRELRRLRKAGKIRTYGGTQPKKKRYVFNVFEVVAALKQESQPAGRLAFDDAELFRRHKIPSSLALSGVSA